MTAGTSPLFDPPAAKREAEQGARLAPRFDRDGLVTAVVTDDASGELLMVAHMNDAALDLTIRTRVAHYWSRSRQELWKKGETSGATQTVREIRVDCDQDAVWLKVRAERPSETCHTHRASCFYRVVDPDGDGRSLAFDPRLPAGV